MSIQQDKYKALRSKSKTTLTNLAKKYGFNIPKNIKNLESFGKRLSNFIEKIQYQDYESGTPIGGQYKQYLKKSGLHDTTQSRQNFKDIKEFTKIAKEINRELNNPRTAQYLDNYDRRELMDLVGNKTTIKDFINSVPEEMLKYSPSSKIEELKKKTDESTLDEILKRTTDNLTPDQITKLKQSFNKKNYGQKFSINLRLMQEYYQEYTNRKMQGKEFDSYKTLTKIIEEV